jgi:hypothetical protein
VAKFLTTYGVSSEIERIIMQAKYSLTLISPYLQVSDILLERLYQAAHREVRISIIYGKKRLTEWEFNKIVSIEHIQLYFHKDLHAKCYFNNNTMIISSMNMYEFSQRNNREMGILMEKENDYTMFIDAINEANSIKKSSDLIFYSPPKEFFRRNGHCIRCSTNIQLNSHRPYCYSCYKKWAVQANPQFRERKCHNCNQDFAASLEQSVCQNCAPIFTA